MSYLKRKKGSLESSILSVWTEAAKKVDEKLVGGQKKLDKDKDGDIDGKDFAILRKEKGKKKVDELTKAQKKLPPALQKAIAKKMKDKKEVKEDLVGGQKKLDKDKDGDLDAKDFAMLRKSKGSMKKEDAMGQEPMKKIKAPMPKEADTTTMKDAPKAKEGMKAVVKTKQVTENKRYLQTKPGSLEEAVLKSRGLVK